MREIFLSGFFFDPKKEREHHHLQPPTSSDSFSCHGKRERIESSLQVYRQVSLCPRTSPLPSRTLAVDFSGFHTPLSLSRQSREQESKELSFARFFFLSRQKLVSRVSTRELSLSRFFLFSACVFVRSSLLSVLDLPTEGNLK